MKDKSENSFEAQWERFCQASGLSGPGDSSCFMTFEQDLLAQAVREKTIPSDWLLNLLRVRGVNPDWVLFGRLPRLFNVEKPEGCYLDGHTEQELREARELLSRLPARVIAEELLRRIGSNG